MSPFPCNCHAVQFTLFLSCSTIQPYSLWYNTCFLALQFLPPYSQYNLPFLAVQFLPPYSLQYNSPFLAVQISPIPCDFLAIQFLPPYSLRYNSPFFAVQVSPIPCDTISVTLRNWIEWTGFQWGYEKGDQHKSDPVVTYRQGTFVSQWRMLEWATWHCNNDGKEDDDAKQQVFITWADSKIVVIWWHDESTLCKWSLQTALDLSIRNSPTVIKDRGPVIYDWWVCLFRLWLAVGESIKCEWWISFCLCLFQGRQDNGHQNNWSSELSNRYT